MKPRRTPRTPRPGPCREAAPTRRPLRAGYTASYYLLINTISYVHQIRVASRCWNLCTRIRFFAQARGQL